MNGRPFDSLRTSERFAVVLRTGVSARRGDVTVVRAAGDGGPPQVGIVASRRVGNAVRRNRAKRRIREALRRVPLEEGTAYVVIASAGAATTEFDGLVRRIRAAIAAIGEEDGV